MTLVYTVVLRLEEESFPVSLLCQCLGVSRSTHYAWRQQGGFARRLDNNRLCPMIRGIFWEHRRRYGTRRMAVELAAGRQRSTKLTIEELPTMPTDFRQTVTVALNFGCPPHVPRRMWLLPG